MREILFRGKRIDNGEWVEGFYCQVADESDGGARVKHVIVVPTFKTQKGFLMYEVDLSTVGQYTGLTNLHNNPIFEGDIIKGVCYAGETEGIVTFKNGYYYIHAYAGYCEQLSRCSHMVEVIGNIHDNPELLEVGE